MEKSLYELVTELCDKQIDKRKCIYENINITQLVKKLRVKAFEILLKKRPPDTGCSNDLEGNTDPLCHLLAWQYTLRNNLNQPESAEALNSFIERLKESTILNDPIVQNIILFLIHLRGSCSQEERNQSYDIFNKVTLKHKKSTNNSAMPYDLYQDKKFHFAHPLEPVDHRVMKTFSIDLFSSEPSLTPRISSTNCKLLVNKEKPLTYSSDFQFPRIIKSFDKLTEKTDESETAANDEGYESPVKEHPTGDIWEIASKMPLNEHRTWESLDNLDPEKELPFACESGPKTLHYIQKIIEANTYRFGESKENLVETEIMCSTKFTKNVKYMLVGMTSDIFLTDDKDMFYLRKGVCIEGVSPQALTSFCSELLCCGSCYRALNQLCSPYPSRNNERYGYIFKELCESIKRYLAFYRVVALSVPDTANLLVVHSHMRGLKDQITALTRMCRVGIYATDTEDAQVPHGVELLNYMYREIVKTVDKNVALVLYSAFYPCCQIYFSRFLQRWLFEGVLIDPYEEFMVKSEFNYTKSRARTYWTRSFSLRHNVIPDFLTELKTDILQCGKTMNLLKLCNPDASLYTHIMGRSLPLISCCLTPKHSSKLRQEIDCYYIEMASLCGPRVSLYHILRQRYEVDNAFLSLVEKKRALTLKKFELRKQLEAEEKAKHKRRIFEDMREQMRLAAEHKKKVKEDELQRDLLIAEQNAQMEELRLKLVKEETKVIITYYNNLIEAVDRRRSSIEQRKQKLNDQMNMSQKLQVESKSEDTQVVKPENESSNNEISESPTESGDINKNPDVEPKPKVELASVDNDSEDEKFFDAPEQAPVVPTTEKNNLDVVNANIDSKLNDAKSVELNNQRNETFLAAQRNRAKVLNLEFDVKVKDKVKSEITIRDKPNLTEAQRNKLRVLSSEFDLLHDYNPVTSKQTENNGNNLLPKPTTEEITANNNELTETNIIVPKVVANLASPGHEEVMNTLHRKKILAPSKPNDLPTLFENEPKTFSNNFQNDVSPMSIDSTPNTECAPTDLLTPCSSKLSICTDLQLDSACLDSALLTANSNVTDDGFKFPSVEPKKFVYEHSTKLLFAGKTKIFSITENIPQSVRPMRLSKEEVKEIKNGNLKLLLYQSVHMPLEAQKKLVNDEILKYFINEQNFFSHLHSLRCYYFLLDGEFGRHITEGLFTKLYEAKNPADLLNCRSLQLIINKALYASSKVHENAENLSFIVQDVPMSFNLSDADVFECLSLSYRINWPLNILLPCDTIERYDQVFKYLLKLHHVSWILQKMCQELKMSQKEYGIDENVLLCSPQYHKIQLYRHVMTHFIQTLQNYTVSQVLQTSWSELENNMKTVNTLDQLYTVHIVYVKTIMFRCLLNKKCAPIMKVIREIFVVILKFYNYLRSRTWNLKSSDLYYTHPNFKKLEDIFNKFEEFTNFVFRVGNKMARVGYQPHLVQMLDMLNMNDYYTNKQNV